MWSGVEPELEVRLSGSILVGDLRWGDDGECSGMEGTGGVPPLVVERADPPRRKGFSEDVDFASTDLKPVGEGDVPGELFAPRGSAPLRPGVTVGRVAVVPDRFLPTDGREVGLEGALESLFSHIAAAARTLLAPLDADTADTLEEFEVDRPIGAPGTLRPSPIVGLLEVREPSDASSRLISSVASSSSTGGSTGDAIVS